MLCAKICTRPPIVRLNGWVFLSTGIPAAARRIYAITSGDGRSCATDGLQGASRQPAIYANNS